MRRTLLLLLLCLAAAACGHRPPRNDEVSATMNAGDLRAIEGEPAPPDAGVVEQAR